MGLGKLADKAVDIMTKPFHAIVNDESGAIAIPSFLLGVAGSITACTMVLNDINSAPPLPAETVAMVTDTARTGFNDAAAKLSDLTRQSTEIMVTPEKNTELAEAFKKDRINFVGRIMFDPRISEAQSVALGRKMERGIAGGFTDFGTGDQTITAAHFAYRNECLQSTEGQFNPAKTYAENIEKMSMCLVNTKYQHEESQLGDFTNFFSYVGAPIVTFGLLVGGVGFAANTHDRRRKKQTTKLKN